jgi:hypothetical protein
LVKFSNPGMLNNAGNLIADADDPFNRSRMLETALLTTFLERSILNEIALDQELITLAAPAT